MHMRKTIPTTNGESWILYMWFGLHVDQRRAGGQREIIPCGSEGVGFSLSPLWTAATLATVRLVDLLCWRATYPRSLFTVRRGLRDSI